MCNRRGSEWGLVFSVICPYFLVFTVKLAIFLMFTVLEKNTVKCLKGDPKVFFKDFQILSALLNSARKSRKSLANSEPKLKCSCP